MTAIEFKNALARAMSVVDGIGRGGATKQNIGQRTAMVELMVLQVRAGELRPAIYLQHPAHLPEGRELRMLMMSTGTKDAQLRADAREWVEVNRREAGIASVSLRNAIESCRIADELLNDPDAPDVVHEWKKEIDVYVRATFACDTSKAPWDRNGLDAWCFEVVMRTNPVPEWLRTFRASDIVRTEEPKTPKESMRTYAARNDDE